MKKSELDRINKEYLINDYERRFKVPHEVIISALIGEDNTSNEYARQKREQKKYFQEIENIRTYNLLESTTKKLNKSLVYDGICLNN